MMPLFWYRVMTSVGLSVLFLVVYGWSNGFTATRTDVGSFYFEWERAIPFLPWMILPYMSIDLFFVVAPFLCRNHKEVKTFARRVGFAIVAAGLCFLLVPLKFSFERPQTGGIMGAVFDWFRTMDQPFNQLPSLHITLTWLLGDVYLRRGPLLVRVLLGTWFALIAASTVFTFQHHVIDVLGGALLGLLTVNIFREAPEPCTSPAIQGSVRTIRSPAS